MKVDPIFNLEEQKMFGHILKRDLKRKKTMNVILFIFIVVASMFMASSIPNIITVINGIQYYEEAAGVGDYVVIAGNVEDEINDFLSNSQAIDGYRMEEILFINGDVLYKGEEKLETNMTKIVQTVKDTGYHYFDENNEIVTEIKQGQVRMTKYIAEDNHLKAGDVIHLKYKDYDLTLTYAGPIKDVLLGTPMMGNSRILLSEEDYQIFENDEEIMKNTSGRIIYIDTQDVKQIEKDLASVSSIAFNGDKSLLDMCYVMEMIVAAIVLVIGIVLIIVSFIVLKFMISFTISEEFREIGVMKAIGIKNFKIRSLYIIKYLAFGIVGSGIGLVLSKPFGDLLLYSVSSNMVLGNKMGFVLNIAGAIIVILATVGFAYLCTGKIKKSTPIDAIRNGQTGERYNKKRGIRIEKTRLSVSGHLAVNDVFSAPKRYLTIMIAFTLCCLLPLIIGNTASTMRSEKLIHLFGVKQSDIYVDTVAYIDELDQGDGLDPELFEEALTLISDKIEEVTGYASEGFVELHYRYDVMYNGESAKLDAIIGVGTDINDYKYTEGVAPKTSDEIAITKVVSRMIGAKIGDTVTLNTSGGKKECIVTAYFETMNNLGQAIRVHNDFETNLKELTGFSALQFTFTDHPGTTEINNRIEQIKEKCDFERVQNTSDFCANNIGVVDTMDMIEVFLFVILIIVVILITILMENSFVASEKSQIAMLKAVGFSNSAIMAWQVKRFGMVGLISLVMAVILSIPATPLIITPIFKMMGAESIDYVFDTFKVFVIYPVIILAVTMLFAYIAALKTNSIKANDTANIE